MTDHNVTTRSLLYWNTLLKIPSQIASLVISIWVARILTPNDFGIFGIAMMLIGFANMLTDFGFGEAIIQKSIKDRKILNSIFTLNLSVSVIFAVIFYSLSDSIALYFNAPECSKVIKVTSSFFIISSFPVIPSAILRRDLNFKTLSMTNLSSTLLMSLTTLFLAVNGFGYWSLALGQLIPYTFVAIFLCARVKWLPVFMYNHSSLKSVYHFGAWNFLKSQLIFASQNIDKLIIGKFLGTVSLGFYDKAMSLASNPINNIITNINGVMYSLFSANKNDNCLLQSHFRKGLALISFINTPIYSGLIVIAPYFVHALLGSKWSPMILPFQILLSSFIIKGFGGLTTSLNVAIGNYRNNTIRFAIAVFLFALICFAFLSLNILGIAIGFLLFCIVEIYLLLNLAIKSMELSWGNVILPVLPGLITSAIMFIITDLFASFVLTDYSFSNMLILVAIGALTYYAGLTLDRSSITKEFKKIIWRDIASLLYKT